MSRIGWVTSVTLVTLNMVAGCTKKSSPPPPSAPQQKVIEIASYKELGAFFDTYGFTYDAWHAGFRAVPRAFVSDVPEKWAKVADQVTLAEKKKIFYSAVLPIVLQANENIMQDRRRMEPVAMQIFANQKISDDDLHFLTGLAARYKVNIDTGVKTSVWTEELMNRVDIIPPALALAQASYESAFATSRFAGLGNALFGQYAYEGKKVVTKEEGKQAESFQIAAFEEILNGVSAYAYNLNTHKAYSDFRKKRAEFRRNGKVPDGQTLASTLIKYSIRGKDYTREVARIIRSHQLNRADLAYLRDMEPITIKPKSK